MNKLALHALDRLRERTRLPDEAVKHLQAYTRDADVPEGFYYLPIQNEDGTHAGYAAFKTVETNSNPNKLVLATILGPHMRPKGTPLPGPLAYRHGHDAAEKAYGIKTAASALRKRLVPSMSTDPTGMRTVQLHLHGQPVATMSIDPRGSVMHAGLDDMTLQGMGVGKKLYGEAIRRMPGQTLHSDTFVSEPAQRVWDSMAKRPGYSVTQAPGFLGQLEGRHTVKLPAAAGISSSARATVPWWRQLLSRIRR